jgi:hypothetical protein
LGFDGLGLGLLTDGLVFLIFLLFFGSDDIIESSCLISSFLSS